MRALRGRWHRSRRRGWRRRRCRRRAGIASGLEADAGQLCGLIRVLTGAAVVETDAGEGGLELGEGVIPLLRRARAVASGGRAGIGLVDGELGLEIRDQVCAVRQESRAGLLACCIYRALACAGLRQAKARHTLTEQAEACITLIILKHERKRLSPRVWTHG